MTYPGPTIRFGGDYNPEQWPRDVWDDDVSLMQQAGVTTATVGVFSWARLEPRPGEFDFEWLDDILNRLHAGGIRVMMATATASPPAWLARDFPESLPVTAEGVRLGTGSRQQYSPSSSSYRTHALRLVETIAQRYAEHPAIEAWHINNEYGCHVSHSYDPESAAAFRVWLAARYGSIEKLNNAWGTAFWSQGYTDFADITPPAAAPTYRNPTQLIDFDRFSADALLALYSAEKEILNRVTPGIPVTTNFMGFFRNANYWKWAREVDFVSDDTYPDPADPLSYVWLAGCRDLMRSLGGGRPWLLMEQSTAAVNWRPRNATKPAGINRAQSLQAVGRGANGILYFQWRQSKAGSEKFHSAMVPHAGADSRVYREVTALGAELATLTHVLDEQVQARTAILFDWDSWWAIEQDATPGLVEYVKTVLAWYRPFLSAGVPVDFIAPGADLAGYDLVVAPVLHVASSEALTKLDAFVADGGHLLATYQTAVLDENLHVYLGGYLGPLSPTLGVRVEEFAVLGSDDPLERATAIAGDLEGLAHDWQEIVVPVTAAVVSTFTDGFAAGNPAVTRNVRGSGSAWYVATQPNYALVSEIVDAVLSDAGVVGLLADRTEGVEAIRRGSMLFLINHWPDQATLTIDGVDYTVAGHDAIVVDPTA